MRFYQKNRIGQDNTPQILPTIVSIEIPILINWIKEIGVPERFHLFKSFKDAPRFFFSLIRPLIIKR
jgi:hypothetical protein